MQADIEVDLVDRPGEEGRVDGDDRAEATHRHAGCRRDGVLLGDADIDASVGESFAEGEETDGVGHGGGDRHELGVLVAELHEGLGERCGVGAGLGGAAVVGEAGLGIVHRLDLVLFGGSESLALLGEHMDDDRPVELGGVLEGLFH